MKNKSAPSPASSDDLDSHLLATATGDRAAFEALYRATSGKLYAIILTMIRDDALTQDILQQAYLAIWTRADSFDPAKGKAFTWMLVITRNKALDTLRKRARVSTTEQLEDTLPDEHARSDRAAETLLLRRLVEPHLETLSEQMQRAVIQSAVYGMTSREIGERAGVSTNTAKSWVRRGLAKLRSELGNQTFDTMVLN